MKAPTANLLNAFVLIAMSAWAYLSSVTPSLTAVIPGVFGMALLLCQQGVMRENKLIAHVAAGLTLVVFVALIMPLRGAFARGDTLAILRVAAMMATSWFAMIAFIRSFIAARKAREVTAP
ncbi:MAG: hypothetical protein QNI87_10930 [Erythrobacter sp.]|uniref:hypothetical protein n=1 Tax=Erythrobacter sp. TaxID=1042 RepID=UPI0026297070|nr:hypothetical protein [Erythrobacter sp.]MDJ0979034.1 hypothetical protein [Erythrobacter sp.]